MFWDFEWTFQIMPDLLAGLWVTVQITVIAYLMALALGLAIAIVRRVPIIGSLLHFVMEFIRTTPLIIQLVFVFLLAPSTVSGMTVGILVLGVHYSSYTAEVYRSGIEGVSKGQWEAARALSLPATRTWGAIVLPQAIRKVIPALGNYLIAMFKDTPLLFTAVTDAVAAELVESNEAPGGNVPGTSDIAPIDKQVELLKELVPDAKSIGVVYASGEVNSQVQVDELKKVVEPMGIEVKTQTVTSVTEIPQAAEALGDVDSIYVPTDNMVVSGIASLVKVANDKKIPVIGAEAGTVEGGAVATLGIDYEALGHQTGEMALKILQDGGDPASMPVETAKEFTYVVNEKAAEAQGVEIPAEILDQAERV